MGETQATITAQATIVPRATPAAQAPVQAGALLLTEVQVSFALGWTMADLYQHGLPAQAHAPAPRAHLPGIGALSPAQRALLRLDQIDADLALLAHAIEARNLRVPTSTDMRTAQADRTMSPEERKATVYAVHLQVLRTLTATDRRLGIAYGLARALAETFLPAHDPDEMAERFRRERLDNLRGWLNDSASSLPAHGAKAVLAGLVRWEAWAANLQAQPPSEEQWMQARTSLNATLRRQGELWRAVLSGEKAAGDMLSVDSYLQAAAAMAQRALALLRPLVRRPVVYGPLLLAVGLLAWGIASGGASQVVGAVVAAAAALGITGATAQKLGEALEKPLWGAEVDAAAGEALTYLPLAPVCEPRADVLLDAPRLLHEIDPPPRPALRPRRPQRSLPPREQEYLRNWALETGYLESSADAQGTAAVRLTLEGRRLAAIPAGEHGSVRAALGAGRGIAAPGAPEDAAPPEGQQDEHSDTTNASAGPGEEAS
ncbi:MAG TPA: hypothetical protein VGY76_05970 [Solirubrobacteraceae bacterium]|jgi:hypothetical protein|nr:hypothetical protein [Solirubrobacteraceae bacterium]